MNKHIFRSYDIRGVYKKDIDENLMRKIGNAFAQSVEGEVLVANDMRLSSESLARAFISGVNDAGKNVFSLGLVPMAVAMFHAWKNNLELAYITASHLPKEWNGVKFFHKDGIGFIDRENYKIRDTVIDEKFVKNEKGKTLELNSKEVMENYKNYLLSKLRAEKPLRIIVDCGNGTTGLVAKDLFEKAGFSVSVIFEKPDGNMPNRGGDPHEDGLEELKKKVGDADLGVAFDGDGDRVVLMDEKGNKLSSEETAYIIMEELGKEEGPIVATVECTHLIDDIAMRFNKDVIRTPVGHTFLVEAVHKHKACFGTENSGHAIIPSITPFDDAIPISIYAAIVVAKSGKRLSEHLSEMPHYPFTAKAFVCSDDKKFEIINKLEKRFSEEYDKVNTTDGVRIDFENSWVLIRASNTEPKIKLSLQAMDNEKLKEMKKKFSKILEDAIKQ